MTDEMVTVSLKAEKKVIDLLDTMVKSDDTDRSKFIRHLIRKEYMQRHDRLHIPIIGTLTGKGDEIGQALKLQSKGDHENA